MAESLKNLDWLKMLPIVLPWLLVGFIVYIGIDQGISLWEQRRNDKAHQEKLKRIRNQIESLKGHGHKPNKVNP